MKKSQRALLYISFGLITSIVGFFTNNDMLIMYGACVTGWCLGMYTDAKINNI